MKVKWINTKQGRRKVKVLANGQYRFIKSGTKTSSKRKSKGKSKNYGGKRMAKRKRKGRRKKQATPAGAAGGTIAGVYQSMTTPNYKYPSGYQRSALTYATNTSYALPGGKNRAQVVVESAVEGLKRDGWKPIIIGVGVSASKKIPLLEILAKPIDRTLKSLTKGKVGL